jgi:hypothetical protein
MLLFGLVLLVPSIAEAQGFRQGARYRESYRESYRGGRAFGPGYVGGMYGVYPGLPIYGGTVYSFGTPFVALPQAVEIRETVIQPAPVYRTETTTTTTTYGPYRP